MKIMHTYYSRAQAHILSLSNRKLSVQRMGHYPVGCRCIWDVARSNERWCLADWDKKETTMHAHLLLLDKSPNSISQWLEEVHTKNKMPLDQL